MEKKQELSIELQFISLQLQAVQLQVENLSMKRDLLTKEYKGLEADEATETEAEEAVDEYSENPSDS